MYILFPTSDFCIEGYTFEIGGRKRNKQIEGLPDAFVVKDNIEFAFAHTIPLWHSLLLESYYPFVYKKKMLHI